LLQQFPAQPFADFGERGSIWTRQSEGWLQMGFQDAVLGQQVLILQEQFLVDEPGHEGQKTGDAGDVWPTACQTPLPLSQTLASEMTLFTLDESL
jgi:hypothetical protein